MENISSVARAVVVLVVVAFTCGCKKDPDPQPPSGSGGAKDEEPIKTYETITESSFNASGLGFLNTPSFYGDLGFSLGSSTAYTGYCSQYFDESFDPETPSFRDETEIIFVKTTGVSGSFDGIYNALITAGAGVSYDKQYVFKAKIYSKIRQPKPGVENLFTQCLTWNASVRGNPNANGGDLRNVYAVEIGYADVSAFTLSAAKATIEGGVKGVTYGEAKYDQSTTASVNHRVYFVGWKPAPPLQPLTETDFAITKAENIITSCQNKPVAALGWVLKRAHLGTSVLIEETKGKYITLSESADTPPTTGTLVHIPCDKAPCSGTVYAWLKPSAPVGVVDTLSFDWRIADNVQTNISGKVITNLFTTQGTNCSSP